MIYIKKQVIFVFFTMKELNAMDLRVNPTPENDRVLIRT